MLELRTKEIRERRKTKEKTTWKIERRRGRR